MHCIALLILYLEVSWVSKGGSMYKILTLIVCTLITACTEDKKTEQVIIPKAQLQVLQQAKGVEAELLKAQQKRDKQYKEQGL
jgi:ABC-type uncharacterized transport system auxiliary subunit